MVERPRLPVVLFGMISLALGCGDLEGIAVGVPDPIVDDGVDTETEPDTEIDSETEVLILVLKEVLITFSPEDRVISGDENELGIQGAWYAYPDSNPDSTIDRVADDEETICAEGEIQAVIDDEYGTYFGAKVGFTLCATEDGDMTLKDCPLYDDLEERLVGIVFDLKVNDEKLPNGKLRLQFTEEDRDDGTYVEVTEGSDVTALVDDAVIGYNPDADSIHKERIKAIDFYISTGDIPPDDSSADFDFCVSNIRLLAYLPE